MTLRDVLWVSLGGALFGFLAGATVVLMTVSPACL